MSDIFDLVELFPSVRSLVWTVVGIGAGLLLYHFVLSGPYAAWIAITAGFVVTIAGIAWQARRQGG